jgi:putative endonuclease
MYYVYIIYSKKLGKKYIGSSLNLKERIKRHNSKRSKFTANGCPWELLYYEVFKNKNDALREEQFLKTGKGRERMKNLFNEVTKN